jgi:hypothetical protein
MPKIPTTVPTEEQDQIKLATWMTLKGIRFYAIANGGFRKPMEAIRLKRQGVQAGVPDLCIPMPRGGFNGMYLELKRVTGGRLSDNQIYWLEYLRSQGYFADCAYGFDEAKNMITNYLGLKDDCK